MARRDKPPKPPQRAAEELTELARQAHDPAVRVWYLEWAKAFQQLALFHERQNTPEDDGERKRSGGPGLERRQRRR
jgi:hypothetical protein